MSKYLIITVKDMLNHPTFKLRARKDCYAYIWWNQQSEEDLFIDTFITWTKDINYHPTIGVLAVIWFKNYLPENIVQQLIDLVKHNSDACKMIYNSIRTLSVEQESEILEGTKCVGKDLDDLKLYRPR